jgi:hypothetical protein
MVVFCACNKRQTIDYDALSLELDSIFHVDQKFRNELTEMRKSYDWDAPELDAIKTQLRNADSSNLARIIAIIKQTGGYPGKSKVGHPANETAFYVLQHAPDSIQETYYDLIIQAGKDKELNAGLVAMYQDRYLMYQNKPQIFGTQIRIDHLTDSLSGEKIITHRLWPIADTTKIDSIRMWNGLGPLEEYLNYFGISRWE